MDAPIVWKFLQLVSLVAVLLHSAGDAVFPHVAADEPGCRCRIGHWRLCGGDCPCHSHEGTPDSHDKQEHHGAACNFVAPDGSSISVAPPRVPLDFISIDELAAPIGEALLACSGRSLEPSDGLPRLRCAQIQRWRL